MCLKVVARVLEGFLGPAGHIAVIADTGNADCFHTLALYKLFTHLLRYTE